MSSLSKIEKERLLKAAETDKEFRYALMGLLGFRELLERFSKLEERQLELERRQQKLEERQQRLEESFAKLEERFAGLEERQQRLEERQQRFEEALTKLTEIVESIRKRQNLMALELGALTESFYSKAFLDDLKEEIKVEGDKIVSRRRNLRIDSEEIDLLVETQEKIYVVEVKVKPKRSDVGELIAKADLVKTKYRGKKVVPLLAGSMLSYEIEKYAEEKDVRVYSY